MTTASSFLPDVARLWAGLALAALLAGCAGMAPRAGLPRPAVPAGWTAPPQVQAAAASEPVPERWWAVLGDAQLDRLIDRAVAAAPDLRTAQLRLREARARVDVADAGRLPGVTASLTASRSRGSAATGAGSTRSLFDAGFDASWEADLFGGQAAAAQAARADLGAAEASLADVAVSLKAEVARNYLDLRGLQARTAVARASLAAQTENWQIAGWRAQAGLVSSLDVEQALASREQTRAQLAALEGNATASRQALELLLGLAPGALASELDAPKPPPAVLTGLAVSLPAEVLRQRADVRQAALQWQAEAARSGQAWANLFPRLTLNGSIGLQALTLGRLGEGGTASLLAGLTAPIFDAGRLRAQLTIQDTVRDRSAIAYEKAVLAALADVEGALLALDTAQRQGDALAIAATASREAARLARTRYQGGLIDFRTVLDAERTALSADDGLAGARAAALAAWVRLYKALGGGWQGAEGTGPNP
jgi:outer membrane protein, multidrug efflux system